MQNSDLLHVLDRLRGPYVEWRRRGSNEGQQHHDQNVIQLYQKLQQLQAYSSSDAQVVFPLVYAAFVTGLRYTYQCN